MGNNPSRAATSQQPQQQQQQQQPQHQQQSTASASPPTRQPSSGRRPSYRRNSLQSPTSSSGKYSSPLSPSAGGVCGGGEIDYLPMPAVPPRRESIATSSIASHHYRGGGERPDLFEDAALRLFPIPPQQPHPQTSFVNPFAARPVVTAEGGGAGILHRPGRGSMESTAASMVDEDPVPECDARAIPTLIQWPHPGTKVYVTGTFCAWEKRYRLSRSLDDGIMSAIVAIPPGTHHVKFLVDGEMRTSPSLPTAVDDTGILVNYLEVSADDMPPLHRVPTPTVDESTTTITTPSAVPLREPSSTTTAATEQQHSSIPPPSTNTPAPLLYTAEIPSYLRDLDNLDDDRSAGYAAPPPPTLPMMLQKVILNGSSSMRDDASVLSIPNHAVLNHLATSSIKNSILAVSATTRYKKKYVTTILYKAATPAED